MYMCQLGIMIYSLFNEKVRKMWRGEREAIQVIKIRLTRMLNTSGFMPLRWENSSKAGL